MLKIENIDKLLAINSQNAEVMKIETEATHYRLIFKHDHLNSEMVFFIDRDQFDRNKYRGTLWVDGGGPFRYDIEIGSFIDPFRFLKFLDDMTYDWDVSTNK
jgi:hypothetical protein